MTPQLMMPKLTDQPVRQMTDREVAGLLTGFIGVLGNHADIITIRRAFDWVARNDMFWQMVEQQKEAIEHAKQVIQKQMDSQDTGNTLPPMPGGTGEPN